ncbi:MAG TPA: hypothetical protein DEG09_04610 [Marinilabiliaceae bacterium]|nr:hypothetical protein [Marinilabiliaceae bacterium]
MPDKDILIIAVINPPQPANFHPCQYSTHPRVAPNTPFFKTLREYNLTLHKVIYQNHYMNLLERYQVLKKDFKSSSEHFAFGEGVDCTMCSFKSDFDFAPSHNCASLTEKEQTILSEDGRGENYNFSYPVFSSIGKSKKNDKAIIMLHGLNERSWDKYLTWAYQLVKLTGSSVILFPIAFHINRSPQKWSNPREMNQLSGLRRKNSGVENSTFVNVALSLRMQYTPEMFPISGIQTYFDLVKLVWLIKAGRHELFQTNSQTNIFAYSIGALLAEILLIANPASLFSGERAFLFCGGATIDKMNGNSRSIMDKLAAKHLSSYLQRDCQVNNLITLPYYLSPLLPKAWESFRLMSSSEGNTANREKAIGKITEQIKTIGMSFDSVIPAEAIANTLKGNYRIISPNYPGSHEVPFPYNESPYAEEVEQIFNTIFYEAADFLA